MALKLSIVSDQRSALGRHASIVLGVGGGSIGRAPDNDWVLPDPECYVSAHHARVQFRHGTYYLLDTSTNGVYVNGGAVRISPRSIYPLRDGDRLRLGPYEVAVRIDVEAGEAPEASAIFPVGAQSAGAYQADIGVSLDVEELLQTGAGLAGSATRAPDESAESPPPTPGRSGARPTQAERLGAVDAYGQSLSIEDTGLQPLAHTARPLALVPPVSKPRREPRVAEPPPAGPLQAFCRGAGVKLSRLPPEAESRLLQMAGVLLRESLMGLKGLALAQRELREQTGLANVREDAQQLALASLPVDELLLRLLLGHERHELDAVQWLRDIAGAGRAHDQALVSALPAALSEFIARLEPRALSHQGGRDERATSAARAETTSESTGMTARFRSITESAPGALPHLFAEAFARAFAADYRVRSRSDHSGG